MDRFAYEHTLLQLLARLELNTMDVKWIYDYIRKAADALNWERIVRAAMEQRVPSLVVGRLVALEQEGDVSVPARAIEPLWEVPGIRKLFFDSYQQAGDSLAPSVRLFQALTAYRANVVATLGKTLDILGQISVPALVIKGGALLPLYPLETRDLSDIDVIVLNQERGWQLIQLFTDRGFSVDSLDVGQGLDKALRIKVDLRSTDKVNTELHIGGFDLLGLGLLEAPLWLRARNTEILAGQWGYIPSPEDALLIVAAHMSREGFFCLRDVNDFYLLLTRHAHDLDWDYIRQTAQQNLLIEALQTLISETQTVYGPLPTPPTLAKRHGMSLLTGWTLRTMVQKASQGHQFWAVPYRTCYIIRFDVTRFSITKAIKHAFDSAVSTVELDVIWLLRRMRPQNRIKRSLAGAARSMLLRILLRNDWRLRQLPTWSFIRLHPVCPRKNGYIYNVIAITLAENIPLLQQLPGAASSTIVWPAENAEKPDFLITPAGVYYATKYTGKFDLPLSVLEERAGNIVDMLASRGALRVSKVIAQARDERCQS